VDTPGRGDETRDSSGKWAWCQLYQAQLHILVAAQPRQFSPQPV
jgi:hypothetical protein